MESLATQALVLFVIRTASNPLRSRPSPLLAATTVGVVIIRYGPSVHARLGFVPLPGAFSPFSF